MSEPGSDRFFFDEYIEAVEQHYPWLLEGNDGSRYLKMDLPALIRDRGRGRLEDHNRFQSPAKRLWGADHPPWVANTARWMTVRLSHKGLLNVKSPFDLVLYSNLIWELQPETVIELGSLQGGSSLWFADQLGVLCGNSAQVHSFDRLTRTVSPRASHPRLRFHELDLERLETLNEDLLRELPHPWIVVDDAHANIANVFKRLLPFLHTGDYYIIEDVLARAPAALVTFICGPVAEAGFCVDSRYTDAYGYNVTSAPNGWLRKM